LHQRRSFVVKIQVFVASSKVYVIN